VSEPVEPQEGTTEGQEPTDEKQTLGAEALQAELSRARREAAKYRTDLRKLQEAQEATKLAEMTELEKLQATVAKLEARAQEAETNAKRMVVRTQATIAATRAGVRPDALDIVTALLDIDTLEVGEDGSVEGLEDAIQAIAKERPFLTASDTKNKISPTNPAEGAVGETRAQKLDRLMYGHKNTMFGGPGGGVIQPTE
jgi:hypothetical protein